MDIKINKQDPSAIKRGTLYSYGTFTNKSGKEFSFTITTEVSDNPHWVANDVTWVDDEPNMHDSGHSKNSVENAIIKKFDVMAPTEGDDEV